MPRLPALRTAAAAACAALLIPAAAAQGAALKLDRPCYHPGDLMLATGSGFLPAEQLTVADFTGPGPITTDADGAFAITLTAPAPRGGGALPADVLHVALAVSDPADGTEAASTPYQVANYTADRGRARDERALRTWSFSGFPTGAAIYGHFVLAGKAVADHRFGTATGACGLLHARARGIAVPLPSLRSGTWTVQLDTAKAYVAHRPGSLETTVKVAAPPR